MTDTQIYVADLAAYNSGILRGVWIDLDEHSYDPDTVQLTIEKMLEGSPCELAEEYAIHDHEGFDDSIGEFTSLGEVCEIAELIRDHGDAALAALSVGDGLVAAKKRLDNGYHAVDSLSDFAMDYIDVCGYEVPSFVHVDWEATGKELAIDMIEVRMGVTIYLFNE